MCYKLRDSVLYRGLVIWPGQVCTAPTAPTASLFVINSGAETADLWLGHTGHIQSSLVSCSLPHWALATLQPLRCLLFICNCSDLVRVIARHKWQNVNLHTSSQIDMLYNFTTEVRIMNQIYFHDVILKKLVPRISRKY